MISLTSETMAAGNNINALFGKALFREGCRRLRVALRRIPGMGSQGFSLIEAMAAIMIISLAVVAGMSVMSATVRSANRSEGNVKLLQLVRSQIETLKQFEFQDDPAGYPLITGLPEGTTVTFEVLDTGISYTRPEPDLAVIDKVIQKITVTGAEGDVEVTITFYKLDTR